jgi:hypothetical protein
MSIHDEELLTNHADVGSALILLSAGLRPFVEDVLKRTYDERWINRAKEILAHPGKWDSRDEVQWEDAYALLKLLKKGWQALFESSLKTANRDLIIDIFDIRNSWAHPSPEEWRIRRLFTFDYSEKALRNILKLLAAIGDHEKSEKVKSIKSRLEDRKKQKDNRFQIYHYALGHANKHLTLTSNFFNWDEETNSSRKEVYVPLGLVERQPKRNKRSSETGDPERGSELYQEQDTVKGINEAQFFEQILKEGISKSQGRRIAIIGEPGSGKTTRLQQIADWIFQSGDTAVWIPLGAIENEKSLYHYLFNDWLNSIHPLGSASSEWKDALKKLLNDNKLWLLLDGADEMPIDSPLSFINQQMTQAWIDKTRVTVTCRLNLWSASGNILANSFDVFRNLDFDLEQTDEFISKTLGKDRQSLQNALYGSNYSRIKDLIKNPLRLMLLCKLWSQGERQLPTTKAGLYQAFAQAIYDWKSKEICKKYSWNQRTYKAKQKVLSQALGELSKRAIDGETSRFRIPETLIRSIFDELSVEPHDESDPDFLELALAIGWLNDVGVAAENLHERVYAFYHPTFEEYFAALAIPDGSFFFNHTPEDIRSGSYRIFEPKWKEVYLLWMGSYSSQREIEVRNELIDLILDAYEAYEGIDSSTFYPYYLLYMTAISLREFEKCENDNIEYILSRIYLILIDKSICNSAKQLIRQSLIETDTDHAGIVIECVYDDIYKDELPNSQEISSHILVDKFSLIYEIAPFDLNILAILKKWIKSGFYCEDGFDGATQSPLWFPYTRIKIRHPEIIQALVEALEEAYSSILKAKQRDLLINSEPEKISSDSLSRVSINVNHLSKYLYKAVPIRDSKQEEELNKQVRIEQRQYDLTSLFDDFLIVLERIAVRSSVVVDCITKILTLEIKKPIISKKGSHIYLLRYLRNIAQNDNKIIQTFLELLADKNEEIRCRAAELILEVDPENIHGIECAKSLAALSKNESILKVMPRLFSKIYNSVHLSNADIEVFNTVCISYLEKLENEIFPILRANKTEDYWGDEQKIKSYLGLVDTIIGQVREKYKEKILASLIIFVELSINADLGSYAGKAANTIVQSCDPKSDYLVYLENIFYDISRDSSQDNSNKKLEIAFALTSIIPDNQEIVNFIISSYNYSLSDDQLKHDPEIMHEYFKSGFEGKYNTHRCLIKILDSSQDEHLEWIHIFVNVVNDVNRREIIDALISKAHSIQDLNVKCDFVYVIGLIEKEHEMVAQTLMDILDKGDKKSIKSATRTVQNLKLDHPEITHKILTIAVSQDDARTISRSSVKGIIKNNTLAKATQKLIILNADKVHPEVLWHCTKKMDYRDFYVTRLEM